jgi:putative phage-type endonuclease
MAITVHSDLIQGSEEWHAARCGLLTASEVDRIITPKLKIADNAKTRAHLWELAAQRITRYVEPAYISDAMLRGHEDEILARALYSEKYAPVNEVGFVTHDKWGFTLGCSPDGLVGSDGMIECKSRCQKFQVQTIVEEYTGVAPIPEEYWLQVQTGLLVTGRRWCDFISYSGGLPMAVVRVEADPRTQDAIIEAAAKFEARINEVIADFHAAVEARGYHPTERRIEEEMVI